jgi:hypothetical protein
MSEESANSLRDDSSESRFRFDRGFSVVLCGGNLSPAPFFAVPSSVLRLPNVVRGRSARRVRKSDSESDDKSTMGRGLMAFCLEDVLLDGLSTATGAFLTLHSFPSSSSSELDKGGASTDSGSLAGLCLTCRSSGGVMAALLNPMLRFFGWTMATCDILCGGL